jgi:putative serine protease PepD
MNAPGGQGAYQTSAFPPPPSGGYQYGPPPAQPPRKRRSMAGIVAAALVAGVVGGGAAFAGAYTLTENHTVPTVLTSSPASPVSTQAAVAPGTVAAAAAKAMPSTVDIRVNLSNGTAEGSGVILTADGDVLTNNHVVAGSTGAIVVTLANGSQHTATVVGTSPSYDLAVLKVQGVSGLTPASLGQSSSLQVGQQVVAIGSPQGLTGTVTTGIVSAFNRTVQVQGENGTGVVYNGLQTDAPINPGNSGGALVDGTGAVIGVNTAIASVGGNGTTGGSIGLGFAIPIDTVRDIAEQLISTGTAVHATLGVNARTVTDGTRDGALVVNVEAGSPAAQAGVQEQDVVIAVDGEPVASSEELVVAVDAHEPGDTVTLELVRDGSSREVQATLATA